MSGIRISPCLKHARRARGTWRLLSLVLGVGAGACGPSEPEQETRTPSEARGAMASGNGLSTNGLSTNGLSTNGLSTNGLSTNGLSTNGFSDWFNQDPERANELMRYIIRCAAKENQKRKYTNPVTGEKYTWEGGLGLAHNWAQGSPATQQEQEVVSACLAAHANKFGLPVDISVLGRNARGGALAYTAQELSTFSEREACFFGNLFDGTGVFAATDRGFLGADESTARACGLASAPDQTDCLPIIHTGTCQSLCQRATEASIPMGGTLAEKKNPPADGELPYYETCTYNGRAYQPLTTRLQPRDIHRCGDGICQFTERCGSGSSADSCGADCGTCPQ
ncbi:hypothetical protein [Corallococcus macrosporus]|uniref:Lipoprotein n=1 Tax=Corallococcus macrosporus DSM 14697 TaxID=1189310 RepID=A0A250JQG8_9BACT|nr:hypothetical protein MYMAC_000951 [Corallococcus macrosporus DSM 14697]